MKSILPSFVFAFLILFLTSCERSSPEGESNQTFKGKGVSEWSELLHDADVDTAREAVDAIFAIRKAGGSAESSATEEVLTAFASSSADFSARMYCSLRMFEGYMRDDCIMFAEAAKGRKVANAVYKAIRMYVRPDSESTREEALTEHLVGEMYTNEKHFLGAMLLLRECAVDQSFRSIDMPRFVGLIESRDLYAWELSMEEERVIQNEARIGRH